MAAHTLRNEDIRALDQTRQRLLQLTTAIQTLQSNLLQSDPLPPWSSFQLQVKIISQQIETLANTLTANNQLLSRLAVFPLPEYPSRTHDGLLAQLLRKKVEPGVEDWIQGGLDIANDISKQSNGKSVTQEELDELWDWAPSALQESFKLYAGGFGGNYTLEERAMGIENVATGLKRELPDILGESDESDDDEDDDEMKEDVKPKPKPQATDEKTANGSSRPAISINDQLKYMVTGILPSPAPVIASR